MDAYRIDRFGSVDGVVLRGGFPQAGACSARPRPLEICAETIKLVNGGLRIFPRNSRAGMGRGTPTLGLDQ
jgi:hypothetical protein